MNDNGSATHLDEAQLAVETPAAGALNPGSPPVPPAPPSPPAPPAPPAPAPAPPDASPALRKAKGATRRAKAKAARQAKAAKTSPKVWASTLGGAIAFAFWTIATATFWKNTFSAETLAALIGSTTTIVAAAAAYFKADLLRSGE